LGKDRESEEEEEEEGRTEQKKQSSLRHLQENGSMETLIPFAPRFGPATAGLDPSPPDPPKPVDSVSGARSFHGKAPKSLHPGTGQCKSEWPPRYYNSS
jgi:hypothetical protein